MMFVIFGDEITSIPHSGARCHWVETAIPPILARVILPRAAKG
jgi:hypothetical protein